MTTDPAALSKLAACYVGMPLDTQNAVLIYLLQQIAGNTMTPAQLAKAAACWVGQDAQVIEAEKVYLLAAAATAAGA